MFLNAGEYAVQYMIMSGVCYLSPGGGDQQQGRKKPGEKDHGCKEAVLTKDHNTEESLEKMPPQVMQLTGE